MALTGLCRKCLSDCFVQDLDVMHVIRPRQAKSASSYLVAVLYVHLW